MDDKETVYGFSMFAPIHLNWDGEQQCISIQGVMGGSDGVHTQFQLSFHGQEALQLLRQFRSLLDHVDEESIEATMPRDLQ